MKQRGSEWQAQRVGGVRVSDSEGDLDRLGSMNEVPLVRGMRQTLEVARRSSASWENTARRAARSRSWCCWFSACSPSSASNSSCAPAVTTSMLLYMSRNTHFCSYGERIIFAGECLLGILFPLYPRRIPETDLSASSPVSASPGGKKLPRRIFPTPAR